MALSPFLSIIILILLLTGEGEVFFLQNRVGFRGRDFRLIKFATMLKDSPNIATGTVTVHNDPRVLPFGRWIRKTKLNEVPQLINILLGQMSFIGPRPQTRRCFDAFPESVKNTIVNVRPGLSGIGSIIFRNEEKLMINLEKSAEFYDYVIMPYKGSLEKWYVKKQSLRMYFLLFFLTGLAVIFSIKKLPWKIFSDLPLPPKQLALLAE